MKKRTKIILAVIAGVVALGVVFGLVDYGRVKNGEMPIFMIRVTDTRRAKLNYIGLGYRMQRYVGVSPKEPLNSSIYVKFGSWFYVWDVFNNEEKNPHYRFSGTIVEVYDGGILVKVYEGESMGASRVYVRSGEDRMWEVGMKVVVIYDGLALFSDPPQVSAIHIEVVE
jgi:hypothetical protein